MRIAFAHQYFPGQFARLARHFVDIGHDVVAFDRGLSDGRSSDPVEGVRVITFGQDLSPVESHSNIVSHTIRFLQEAGRLAVKADGLRQAGWIPDVVYSHTGWGNPAYLSEVFPAARFVKYCEWYYNNQEDGTEFLEGATKPLLTRVATSVMNVPILADLAAGDLLISPTEFQRSQFPRVVRSSIEIAPDGIDMAFFAPDASANFELPDGRRLTERDRIVTYVARGADPFRGFRPFLEALSLLQARDPHVQALILGDRTVYYGEGLGTEDHFYEVTASVKLDAARTHFLGKRSYQDYRDVLRISSAHVYLTVPFVLSWSMLEAMAAGCLVIGSDTAPVREFISDCKNGFLVDFFNPVEIAARIEEALAGGAAIAEMRNSARRTLEERWSVERAMARHEELLERVMSQSK